MAGHLTQELTTVAVVFPCIGQAQGQAGGKLGMHEMDDLQAPPLLRSYLTMDDC